MTLTGNLRAMSIVPSVEAESTNTISVPGKGSAATSADSIQRLMFCASLRVMITMDNNVAVSWIGFSTRIPSPVIHTATSS